MAFDKIDEFDWVAAFCLGLGMTQEQAGDHLGCTRQTIANHCTKIPKFFDHAIREAQAIKAKIVTPVIQKTALDAETRLKGFFDRAFAISEKVLSKAELMGDELTIKEAMEIHKSFTQWAAKFAASEAPRRMQFEGTVQHDHKLIPAAIFTALEGVMREQKLLEEPIDAEVLEDLQ